MNEYMMLHLNAWMNVHSLKVEFEGQSGGVDGDHGWLQIVAIPKIQDEDHPEYDPAANCYDIYYEFHSGYYIKTTITMRNDCQDWPTEPVITYHKITENGAVEIEKPEE